MFFVCLFVFFFFGKKKVVFLVFSCKENISKKKNKIMNTGFKKKC